MTDKEIIGALRLCSCETSTRNCPTCPLSGNDDCVTDALREAADIIERLTAESADLRKEIEWKDMVIALAQRKQAEAEAERDALLEYAKLFTGCDTCKHSNYCKTDSECNACAQDVKGNCYCKDCERGSNWEWRGLPEALEGEKT